MKEPTVVRHTCVGTLVFADPETRKIEVVLMDGDQYTENLALRVPKGLPVPAVVDDGEFLDKFGRLPDTREKCHVKIGYEYAYDVERHRGAFKLRGPAYLGEVRARSCSSMNRLKKKRKEAP